MKIATRIIRNSLFDFKNGLQRSDIILVSLSYGVRTSLHDVLPTAKSPLCRILDICSIPHTGLSLWKLSRDVRFLRRLKHKLVTLVDRRLCAMRALYRLGGLCSLMGSVCSGLLALCLLAGAVHG